MILKNINIGSLLFIVILFLLAACGSSNESESNEESLDLKLGTGSIGGTYCPLGLVMAKQFEDVAGVSSVTAMSTGGSIVNILEMAQGKYQLSFSQNDIAYYAEKGTGLESFKDNPITNISGIAALYPEDVQIIVVADSGITSLADLKGKRVAVGERGSGIEANAKQILEAAGLNYTDLIISYLDFEQVSQNFQTGRIDAAFITAGTPTVAVEDLGKQKDIKILSLESEVIDKLTKAYPYYISREIESSTYADYGQSEKINTVAVMALLVVDRDLSEEIVYNLIKRLFEKKSKLNSVHVRGADIILENATKGMSINLHPGAKKYYLENGIEVLDGK